MGGTVKLAKHKELSPYDESWFYTRATTFKVQHLYLQGRLELAPQPRERTPAEAPKNCRQGAANTLGQRDWERITRQVAAANKMRTKNAKLINYLIQKKKKKLN